MISQFVRCYLLPGIVFQSIVIAGGYATGQELVQYFLKLGPLEGLLGMLVTMVVWSLLAGATFSLAYRIKAYDYKRLLQYLLGKNWVIYEIFYIYVIVIVLSVIAITVAHLLESFFHIPLAIGVIVPLLSIFLMSLKSSSMIEKTFVGCSALLYMVFFMLLILTLVKTNTSVISLLQDKPHHLSWIKNGIIYACYNIAAIPAITFSLRHLQTARQAIIAGWLAGPIGMLPGILFYLALLTDYPVIVDVIIPSQHLLDKLGYVSLSFLFYMMLTGTLLATGVGLLHAFYKRLETSFLSSRRVAMGLILLAGLFTQWGLIELIAKGYTVLSWLTIAIFVLPLLVKHTNLSYKSRG